MSEVQVLHGAPICISNYMKNIALIILGIVLGIVLCYAAHNHKKIDSLESRVKVQEFQIEQMNDTLRTQSQVLIKLIDAMPSSSRPLQLL
jgi:hypothetical protein